MKDELRIDYIKKKGRNFVVMFEDEYSFLVTGSILNRYSLKANMRLSIDLINEIKFESDSIRGRDYINYLLSHRAYSIGQIIFKLKEKGYDENVSRLLIEEFRAKGFLDDNVFAEQMTESILRTKPAGKAYIISKLRQKRIPYQMAQSVVDKIFQDVDESEIAASLLGARWRYFMKFDLETARKKAYNYLSRRSIGYSAAKEAFEKILQEEES